MTDNTEPTIQPIQSHTEILIQQAYDRGYADKAMKVDQAIEMEHSAKGCTRKCHTEPTIDAISRQQFARLANPAKHYLIDNVGMDELNAGLMAANIVEAQSNTVLALISDQVAKAIEQSKPLYTKQRIAKGVCKYGHIGQYTKSVKGFNYCKQCHHEQDRRLYLKRKALKGVKNKWLNLT